MLINNTDALRWLVCVVISLCLPLPVQKTGLLFSLVFVLVSARPKQRKFLFFWLSSVLVILFWQLKPPPALTAPRISGTVSAVSANSFILENSQGRFQVISENRPGLDDQVEVEGESSAFEENYSFYGFDAKAWSLREKLNGRMFAKTVKIVSAGKTPRAFLYRRIEAIRDPAARALAGKLILGVNEEEGGLAILLRCGFQVSVLIQGLGMICGWFWTDRNVRRIRLGTVLGIAAILHFPYPLVRLVLSEGFRLNPHRDKIETFKTKWLLLALLAPRRVATAAFLLPFAFALLAMFPARSAPRTARFTLSWTMQSFLFHAVNPMMVLGMRVLRWGLALCTLGSLAGLVFMPFLSFSVSLAGLLDQVLGWGGELPGQLSWLIVILAGVAGTFPKRVRMILFCGLIGIWTLLGWWHPWASLTLIDVGQGDSILIRLPYNQGNLLIDTGKPAALDQVEAMLQGEGVRRLDALILTHEDDDHSGNKEALIEAYQPAQVIETMTEPLTLHGLTIFNLNPDSETRQGNEGSLVLLLRMQDLTMILSGDAPAEIEQKILDQIPGLRADIVKLGHHGSRTSSCARWLQTLRPIVALNSSGRNNRYQHPHPEVMQRLEDCRIGMFDTKQEGDIRIIVTPICNFLFTARRGFAIIG